MKNFANGYFMITWVIYAATCFNLSIDETPKIWYYGT